jgi:alpha-glucosidase
MRTEPEQLPENRQSALTGFPNDVPASEAISATAHASGIDTTHFVALKRVGEVRRISTGVEMSVDDALLRIDVLRTDVVRLKITRTGVFDEQPTFAVVADTGAMRAPFSLAERDDTIVVQTSDMSIVVTRAPFAIDAYRADGSVVFESERSASGHGGAFSFLNDEFLLTRTCRIEDAMYGLGEKTGKFNRKGRNFILWNTDVLNPDASGRFVGGLEKSDPRRDPTSTEFDPYYVSIPFFQHLRAATGQAAGCFIDNGYLGRFEFQDAQRYRIHFSGGEYTEYVFAGPGLAAIVERYSELTGRISAPPIWALGYHQCRWHAYTQFEIEHLADQFRAESIPCDTLWLDIEHMDGYRVFTWNDEMFPDVPKMMEKLKQRKLRAITIIDPGVKAEPGFNVFESGLKHNAFCKTPGGHIYTGQVWPGRSAFPDFSKEEARRWWGALNASHVQSGLAGIWNDMNEPATGNISEQAMRFGDGAQPHERYHNQYGLLMAMATQEGLLSAMPDKRTFVLSRAGFAGIQRYAAVWMGDNMARWDHLRMSVPMALGLGLSGQPFLGADIGGFAESTNPELFVRWVQCGTLTPFCRNHNNAGCVDQYPWSFGESIEKIVRRSIELRYRLMPALYTAFIASSETGLPIQRPLVLDYQSDVTVRNIDDQYLLGENILVAPVVSAGSTARQVYLPKGGWRNLFDEEHFQGGQYVVAQTPLEYIPVFVKDGAVIPMWPEAPPSTMDYHPGAIELHTYIPSEDGVHVSRLQEDDGVTFAYRDGACYRSTMELERSGDHLTLTVETTGDGYPEFARNKFAIVFHGEAPPEVVVGSVSYPVHHSVALIPNSGQSFRLDAWIGAAERAAHASNGKFVMSVAPTA